MCHNRFTIQIDLFRYKRFKDGGCAYKNTGLRPPQWFYYGYFFIDIQKEEIPEFLIQGKDQEGFEERYISDFIGNFSVDNIFKTASI